MATTRAQQVRAHARQVHTHEHLAARPPADWYSSCLVPNGWSASAEAWRPTPSWPAVANPSC
eukprot:6414645-Prymnesium_polylepis.2